MISLKKIALTFGIAVLFTLFIVFLIDAIYETPKYENYCTYNYPPMVQKSGEYNCTSSYNETLVNKCYKDKGEVRYNYDEKGCEKDAYCDYCSKEFNEKNSKYNKNIFYLSALIGIIAIIAGLYLPVGIDAISSGFIFGGVMIIIQGTFRVFGDLGKISRVIVLGIELVLLIWIGYKKVRDKK